jgi:Zn-dependent protease with chaperone function
MTFFLRLLIACYFPFVAVLCLLSLGGTVALIVLLIQSGLWYWALPAAFLALAGFHMLYVLYFVITFKPERDFFEMKAPREQLAKLYDLVNGVADQWGLDPPDEIRLGAGTVAHVYENEKHKRILVIGGIAVAAFSQETLAGIVAHELAHFTHGDTALSRQAFRRRLTMDGFRFMCWRVKLNYVNPLVWLALLYQCVYRLVDAAQSRQQEYSADRYAVQQAGAEATASALIYVCVSEHLRWANLGRIIESTVKLGDYMVPIFARQVKEARETELKDWKKALQTAVMQGGGLLDSHPSLPRRLKAIGVLPKRALKVALDQEGTPASELIPGWERIEKDLSERLMAPYRAHREALKDAYQIMKAADRIHQAGGKTGF